MADYPSAIVNFDANQDDVSEVDAAYMDARDAEIEAIETVLGINPAKIGKGTAFPGSPAAGDMFWRTDLNLMFYYTGSAWAMLNNPWGAAIANRLALPGLRGLWLPHAGYNGAGATQEVIDLSGQARHLTINGNPTFGVKQVTGLSEVPYIDLDGTGDYLNRADEVGVSITGELTLMGWLALDDSTPASTLVLGGHYVTTGDQRSFGFIVQGTGKVDAAISANGTATIISSSPDSDVLGNGVWNHLVLRYIPSAELSLFVNGVEYLNTTSIPASLHDSTGAFSLGGTGDGTIVIAGLAALWGLHAAALTDTSIAACYAQERAFFGV